MNLFELIIVSIIAIAVLLLSKGIAHLVGIPVVLATVGTIAIGTLLVRLASKIDLRSLLLFPSLLSAACLSGIALQHSLNWSLREVILTMPISAAIAVLIVGKLFRPAKARQSQPTR